MEKEILAPGIVKYSNLLKDREDLAKLAINEIEWLPGLAAESRSKKEGYENIRQVKAVPFNALDLKLNKWYQKASAEFLKCQSDYVSHYAIDVLQNKQSEYQLVKYDVGDYFSEHTDSVPEEPREISGVFYINDDYEGGELFFSQFNLLVKPVAGDYLLFPSIWAYSHIAKPVLLGSKLAVVHFVY